MAPDAAGLGSDSSSRRQRWDLCSNLDLSFCKVVCYLACLFLSLPSLGIRLKTQFLHSVLPSCGKHDSSSVLEEGHVAANASRMSYHRRKPLQAALRFFETKIVISSLTKEFCSVSCCELRFGDIEDKIFKL